MYEVILKKKLI